MEEWGGDGQGEPTWTEKPERTSTSYPEARHTREPWSPRRLGDVGVCAVRRHPRTVGGSCSSVDGTQRSSRGMTPSYISFIVGSETVFVTFYRFEEFSLVVRFTPKTFTIKHPHFYFGSEKYWTLATGSRVEVVGVRRKGWRDWLLVFRDESLRPFLQRHSRCL